MDLWTSQKDNLEALYMYNKIISHFCILWTNEDIFVMGYLFNFFYKIKTHLVSFIYVCSSNMSVCKHFLRSSRFHSLSELVLSSCCNDYIASSHWQQPSFIVLYLLFIKTSYSKLSINLKKYCTFTDGQFHNCQSSSFITVHGQL